MCSKKLMQQTHRPIDDRQPALPKISMMSPDLKRASLTSIFPSLYVMFRPILYYFVVDITSNMHDRWTCEQDAHGGFFQIVFLPQEVPFSVYTFVYRDHSKVQNVLRLNFEKS